MIEKHLNDTNPASYVNIYQDTSDESTLDNQGTLENTPDVKCEGMLDNQNQDSPHNIHLDLLDYPNNFTIDNIHHGTSDNRNKSSHDNLYQVTLDNDNATSDNKSQMTLDNLHKSTADNQNQGTSDNQYRLASDNTHEVTLDNQYLDTPNDRNHRNICCQLFHILCGEFMRYIVLPVALAIVMLYFYFNRSR